MNLQLAIEVQCLAQGLSLYPNPVQNEICQWQSR